MKKTTIIAFAILISIQTFGQGILSIYAGSGISIISSTKNGYAGKVRMSNVGMSPLHVDRIECRPIIVIEGPSDDLSAESIITYSSYGNSSGPYSPIQAFTYPNGYNGGNVITYLGVPHIETPSLVIQPGGNAYRTLLLDISPYVDTFASATLAVEFTITAYDGPDTFVMRDTTTTTYLRNSIKCFKKPASDKQLPGDSDIVLGTFRLTNTSPVPIIVTSLFANINGHVNQLPPHIDSLRMTDPAGNLIQELNPGNWNGAHIQTTPGDTVDILVRGKIPALYISDYISVSVNFYASFPGYALWGISAGASIETGWVESEKTFSEYETLPTGTNDGPKPIISRRNTLEYLELTAPEPAIVKIYDSSMQVIETAELSGTRRFTYDSGIYFYTIVTNKGFISSSFAIGK